MPLGCLVAVQKLALEALPSGVRLPGQPQVPGWAVPLLKLLEQLL